MATIGIDFGTSNTAAGVIDQGRAKILTLEGGKDTMPTAIFLDFVNHETLYGRAAAQAMIDGMDGRFMRSLKSILGTPLAREKRQFLNERLTLIDVIARFLGEIRERAEHENREKFRRVLSGRPVRFHSKSDEADAQALVDLKEAYHLAGFDDVSFLPEPEAAAIAAQGSGRVLIVDIGGGTSDFTVCERSNGKTKLIASEGIRLGGTDFDRDLNIAHVMPLLGYDADIRNEMGPDFHAAPRSVFRDLATWEKIAFMYSPTLLRDVRRWERLAKDPVLFARLGEVLEMHLGHDIAYAVEAGKIAANGSSVGIIDLKVVEKGLAAELPNHVLQMLLIDAANKIADCASATIAKAGCRPDQIDRVVFVGGSSLLGVIQNRIAMLLPDAKLETSEVFTAVVDGLAIASETL